MKKLIVNTTAVLLIVSAAHAADQKSADQQGGMMQGDMAKNCQSHMKDGKMMDSIPKDMMAKCQKMMKDGGMMGGDKNDTQADNGKSDSSSRRQSRQAPRAITN